MANTQQAKVMTPEKLRTIRHQLPQSWNAAIGLLKRKKVDPLRYQKYVRKGWSKRMKKLVSRTPHAG